MNDIITLALSKGRIFDETLPLLKAAGIEVLEDPEKSRKLILPTNRADVQVVLVRASDVPTYVQYGGADLGVCGKDTLIEHQAEWGGAAVDPAGIMYLNGSDIPWILTLVDASGGGGAGAGLGA